MKLRSLLTLAMVALIFASCGVNDLEDRLDKVEHALGTDEPIKVDFTTTNYDDQEIAKKGEFVFKTTAYNSSYVYDYGDNTYYVEIYRYSDVFGNEEASIEFYYDATTKEVTDKYAHIEFRDQSGQNINPYFAEYTAGNTVEITVNSFNPENGSINVEVNASTDAAAENNEYEGKPMTCKFNFKGKLERFID